MKMDNYTNNVLLVDDEEQILLSYSVMLRTSGLKNVFAIQDSRKVMPFLAEKNIAVIVLDLIMPHISGNQLIERINRELPHVQIIVMTATNELEIAVDCMKEGAVDYLVKPVEKSRFISSVKKALELRTLRDELSTLKHHLLAEDLDNEAAFSKIITRNSKMLSIFHYAEAIAKTMRPVCITGETGVGKELLSGAIHNLSELKGEFVAVNVAGLDDTIFSDTLFGHKKGAYTSADSVRKGLIVRASGGTLLLDEIGDLSEGSQLKLLRLLEENKYYPLGSDIPETCDVRIIATTNRDLNKLISEGLFRKDLYYRLCVHSIHLPPLRDREDDIPLLLAHFIENAAESLDRNKPFYPNELATLLLNYHFPGNIRELQAMVFDAIAQHKSGILSMNSFKAFIEQKNGSTHPAPELDFEDNNLLSIPFMSGRFPTLKESEEFIITEALRLSSDNQGIAASLLGITRQALNKRLKRAEKLS
jgi:DNA-binding NtrC family response regulator